MTLKISLICATYNRVDELYALLYSLSIQEYKNFEVIVVDQNPTDILTGIIEQFNAIIDIIYVRNSCLGSSTNRMHGLLYATGDIVAFPDDDCSYYPNTLTNVVATFIKHSCDVVYGKIYNQVDDCDIMRQWPRQARRITTIYDILQYSSAIVIFMRKSLAEFDERFGVNQLYGALEDIDLCYRLLQNRYIMQYSPLVMINHPEVARNFLNYQKAYLYGEGWGAFAAKHNNWRLRLLLVLILCYIACRMCLDSFYGIWNVYARKRSVGRWYSLMGRIAGYWKFSHRNLNSFSIR